MIDNTLIENALALTDENIEDMMEWVPDEIGFGKVFSIEKFCYYLLSPEFIEKYMPLLFPFEITSDYEGYLLHTAKDFGEAIYEYQSGNEDPLIELLSKIGN